MTDKKNVYLNQVGVVCAAGHNILELKCGLEAEPNDLMTLTDAYGTEPVPVAMCQQVLPDIPMEEACWQSRNNQLALAVYHQIQERVDEAIKNYGAERVGVVIGTSTSGISDAENAIQSYVEGKDLPKNYHYRIQEMANTAEFIATLSGALGPVYAVSTACSSGAKSLASAKRLITAGLCDVVIAGGVDTLCKLTLQGFSALEAVSKSICNPFSQNRNGINIGEAGALFIVSANPEGVKLSGVGESSDAHHISAPEPEGTGAERAMRMALADAGLKADDIDYVNLHGTATPLNDQMESRAVSRVFPASVLCSSTKPMTGHTLGAAGAVEAAICWLTLMDNAVLPVHHWDGNADPELPEMNFVTRQHTSTPVRRVLSNSFAFGGNNVALVMEGPE
ncbi:beta-ketoacyl-[acyl-carrier-protein] synthase family protein [Methylophaga sp.]|uniref:beta-ketoacyl-[acyl-carrier-protein] synthase family protein n=1 Tax=Methylophaga sp. TaxID=2024840 RepID=UPI003A92561C